MKPLSLHTLLLSLGFQGLFWTLLLFALCFGGIFLVELAKLGWTYRNEPLPQSEEKKEKTPAEKPQEPIYYIVEKKKRKSKNGYEYSEPQPFTFKEH